MGKGKWVGEACSGDEVGEGTVLGRGGGGGPGMRGEKRAGGWGPGMGGGWVGPGSKDELAYR